MTFEQTLFVWCILLPAVIVTAAWLLARRIDPRGEGLRWRGLLVTIGWWIAVLSAMVARHGWQWWPEDAWRQSIWPLVGWAVLLAGSFSDDSERGWRWIVAGVLACATAFVAMPSGDEWSDTFPLHRVWMFVVATSCLVNSFALERMARHGAMRWCLWVALAGLPGSLALASATYGSLAEWTLAIVVATLVAACLGIASNVRVWLCAFPVFAAASSITAAGRFYSYEDHPAWVYALILYGPALLATIDMPMRHRPTWQRVTTIAVLSLAMVGSSVWAVLR